MSAADEMSHARFYEPILTLPDGEIPVNPKTKCHDPRIWLKNRYDRMTPEAALWGLDEWCQDRGWTWCGDERDGTLASPEGVGYLYQIYHVTESWFTEDFQDGFPDGYD